MSDPRPPIPVEVQTAGPSRLSREVPVPDRVVARLGDVCAAVDTSDQARLHAGRDWWPLSMVWAADEMVPAQPAVVARPSSAAEVAAVLAVCNDAGVPVTPFAGRSGVCGGSLPVFGGVSLDVGGLDGLMDVDDASLLIDVRAGTYGDTLDELLRSVHGVTHGHWPQSVVLATVGGWLACRGAGQYSTRYGKVEDMVDGLEVALADGRLIRTGGHAPRSAAGPDLTQLFVGSEGTLGVITSARLRVHPVPPAERRAAYRFADFAAGLEACRRILRRGATPAVLRLYDPPESARSFDVEPGAVLVVLDEGDGGLIDAVMAVVQEEAVDVAGAEPLPVDLVEKWLSHRNNLPPLESLVRGGIVADTIEIAAGWGALPSIYRNAVDGIMAVPGSIAASAHQSHSYLDGACLYFTFAGRPDPSGREAAEAYYRAAWDAVIGATVDAGGALSHHHGVGLNRSRYMASYLGDAFGVLAAVKGALDPNGILNPGKLGLPSPFGPAPWP